MDVKELLRQVVFVRVRETERGFFSVERRAFALVRGGVVVSEREREGQDVPRAWGK